MVQRRRRAAFVTLLLVPLASLPRPASAGEAEEHCLLVVTGRAPDGEYTTEEPRCFERLEEVAALLDVDVSGDRAAASTGRSIAAASGTIGIHYDGAGFTGSSITVSGSSCSGGYVNLTVDWRNRISSTINGCPQVRFYDVINMGGGYEATFSNGNLAPMNNASDSIQYRT